MRFERGETITNIAYPVMGLLSFFLYGNATFAMAMITLGTGSFLYHKWKDKEGRWPIVAFDWFTMALVQVYCMGYLAQRHLPEHADWIHAVILVGLTAYGFSMGKRNKIVYDTIMFAVPLMILSFFAQGVLITSIIVAIFAISLYLRSKDHGHDQETFHDSWGHSVWHVLTAIGFFLLIHLYDIL
jgi:hypothetical protein